MTDTTETPPTTIDRPEKLKLVVGMSLIEGHNSGEFHGESSCTLYVGRPDRRLIIPHEVLVGSVDELLATLRTRLEQVYDMLLRTHGLQFFIEKPDDENARATIYKLGDSLTAIAKQDDTP